MSFEKILAQLRKDKGYTQAEVAEYIDRHSGKSCSYKIVSHWENGVSSPTVEQFLLLCEFLGVRDIQSTFRNEDSTYNRLSKLNALGKSRVEEYISMLVANPMFLDNKNDCDAALTQRIIKLYTIPAAAGSGTFLDSEHYVELDVDETVPESADFAVRVSGDSMEPRFFDGQVIFVKIQKRLDVGEIGVFSLNGDSYVKKLGNGKLISLNPRYKPITICEFDSFYIFGKVVG